MKSLDLKEVHLGLRENWEQFSLLIVINGFVGGMVGLERTILPRIAEQEFHIAAKTAILSFIVVFGITKACTNYFTGSLANKFGRKNLLLTGWLFGLPVPFILIHAPDWNWVVFANILLGINQGLAWSTTVVMKIDLVGEKDRGFAMGLNEFAGYVAVAFVGFATGWIASEYGIRPYPFYIGIGLAFAGLLLSFLVRDTAHFSDKEAQTNNIQRLKNVFWDTTWRNKNLGSVTQAGLINNLNDGMAWGLLPILFLSKGYNLSETAILVSVYPAVWGVCQLFTGKMGDYFSKRLLLFWGMFIQGMAILSFILAGSFYYYLLVCITLGFGTAMVYPIFLATIADYTNPADRPQSLGTFRLWRDLGYAIGALITGLIADLLGLNYPIIIIGAVTLASAFILLLRMDKKNVIPYFYNRQ
jgi:MFS family permease